MRLQIHIAKIGRFAKFAFYFCEYIDLLLVIE